MSGGRQQLVLHSPQPTSNQPRPNQPIQASGPERRDHARALARLAAKAMKDKVPNVFHSSVGLLTALLDGMAGGGRDVAAAVEQVRHMPSLVAARGAGFAHRHRQSTSCNQTDPTLETNPQPQNNQALPVLIERLGDSNARLRDGAREAILALARNRESGLRLAGGSAALLRPVKSQTAWRPVLGTLQLMQVGLVCCWAGWVVGGLAGRALTLTLTPTAINRPLTETKTNPPNRTSSRSSASARAAAPAARAAPSAAPRPAARRRRRGSIWRS